PEPEVPGAVVAAIRTNRDLYLAVADLTGRHRNTGRALEEYLRALWALGQGHHEQPALPSDEFFGMLSAAFDAPAPPFDEGWRGRYGQDTNEVSGFDGWEARVLRQIVDLREMKEQGVLDSELRYLG